MFRGSPDASPCATCPSATTRETLWNEGKHIIQIYTNSSFLN